MKYQNTGILISLLLSFHPASIAGQKPVHTCSNGNNPSLNLGGYDVLVAHYGTGFFASNSALGRNPAKYTESYSNALIMLNELWRKDLGGDTNSTIRPAMDFHPNPLDTSAFDDDDKFAFERHKNEQNQWVLRGVGVQSGASDTDPEISEDEGLYVTFGGLAVNEVFIGVRAFFNDTHPTPLLETGLVTLYKDGVVLATDATRQIQADGGEEDGQEYYKIQSPSGAFDAMSFITYSHSIFNITVDGRHDYYLEYIDLCHEGEDDDDDDDANITGDPHIRTWSGKLFDFHGICDLVLLQNTGFENGLGLDIHVRTKQLKQFSYASSAVVRIGNDILEVTGDDDNENMYYLNKQGYEGADQGIIGVLNGFPISYENINSKQNKFTINIGNEESITVMTFKKIVRVDIVGATKKNFEKSLGLLGAYGSGNMIARDGTTILDDANAFGQEWQVLPFEEMLFHSVEGPQAPEKCFIPVASSLRRRLGESNISEEEAKVACARVNAKDFDICVFDVMATGDKDMVGAY